jgi:uncharacterized protein (DUF58 family)
MEDSVGQVDARQVDVPLVWRTSALAQSLFIGAAVALAAAILPGRWQLIAFAAPMLGVLSSLGWQRLPATLGVVASPSAQRCFEGERVRVVAEVSTNPAGATVDLTVAALPAMQIDVGGEGDPLRRTVDVCAARWGSYPLTAHLDVTAPGGLRTATGTADIADIFVFPLAAPPSTATPRAELPERLGTHLTRHSGPGVEYADIRPYVPGDQLRTVNWSVSARRGSLHVTERLTDRSVDVVVLVDASAQPAGPATADTARAVEGAVQVVQSALRNGDRAGVVALGGQRPHWLSPDIGQRQFYRVLDAVLGVSGRQVTGTLAPQAAVPPGAVVVAFSTLLDTAFGLALVDLRRRGHVVVVVDVLQGYPLGGDADPLLQRMWALERSAMCRDMRVMGVEVIPWPAAIPLDHAMRMLPDSGRRRGRRRR